MLGKYGTRHVNRGPSINAKRFLFDYQDFQTGGCVLWGNWGLHRVYTLPPCNLVYRCRKFSMARVERCSMKTFLECTPSGMQAGMFSNLLSDFEIQGLVFRMSLQDQSIPRSFCFLSLLKTTTDYHYHKLKLLSKSNQKSCRYYKIGCYFWQLLWGLQCKGTKGLSNDQ